MCGGAGSLPQTSQQHQRYQHTQNTFIFGLVFIFFLQKRYCMLDVVKLFCFTWRNKTVIFWNLKTSSKVYIAFAACKNLANEHLFHLVSVLLSNSSPGVGLSSTAQSLLSRPMQRKLVTLVHCQLVEEEGRVRAMRAARSLGERTVTELILQHQNPQQLSSNLWAAVRARGCQFLGPGRQLNSKKTV